MADAPVCCGRKMRRDGSQWVCRKCRGWLDAGVAFLAAVVSGKRGVRA